MQFDLVFEGGGAKGSVFIGALEEFEDRGQTARRLIGTSAGAITATLMAAGYSSADLSRFVDDKTEDGKPRFSTFMDVPAQEQLEEQLEEHELVNSLTYTALKQVDLPWIPGMAQGLINRAIVQALMGLEIYRQLFSFNERGGLYAGEVFRAWITKKLNDSPRGRNDPEEPGLGESTLASFHERTKKTGSELSLVASNSKRQEMMVLNHRTAPKCPVAWAVRMSMSIPFLWQEVRWKPAWGEYQGQDIHGDAIVDGGVLSNFPIHLLTSTDPEVAAFMGTADLGVVPTLGLLIDETREVEGAGKASENKNPAGVGGTRSVDLEEVETVKRIGRLIDTITNSHDTPAMQAHEQEICRLPAKGYGTTEFDMRKDRLTALIEAGKKAMVEYLDGLTYTAKDASKYARCSSEELRKAIEAGRSKRQPEWFRLPAEGGGEHPYRIKQAELAKWMERRARDRLRKAMKEDDEPRVRSAMKELMDLLGRKAESDAGLEAAELWWRNRNHEKEKAAGDVLEEAMKGDK